MKTLAIVLVGGTAKIAADGIFGVLALLRLYTSKAPKNIFFCPSILIGAAWKDEGSGLLFFFSGVIGVI